MIHHVLNLQPVECWPCWPCLQEIGHRNHIISLPSIIIEQIDTPQPQNLFSILLVYRIYSKRGLADSGLSSPSAHDLHGNGFQPEYQVKYS